MTDKPKRKAPLPPVPPTKYTADVPRLVFEHISAGGGVQSFCDMFGINLQTFYNWLHDVEKKELFDNYARARENRAYARAERIDTITKQVLSGELKADAARVIIDAEKWQAGKEKSPIFGDKTMVAGHDGGKLDLKSVDDKTLVAQITELIGKAEGK